MVAAAHTPELAASWAAVIDGLLMVRLQFFDERDFTAKVKLGGDFPLGDLRAPVNRVALVERTM
jgi:hypothetical protein